MKAAENQGDNDKAAKLKEQVALQRRTLDRMVLATLNLGHPTIVEKYARPLSNFWFRIAFQNMVAMTIKV